MGDNLMREILKKEVEVLDLNRGIKQKLINREIDSVFELCNYSRMELSDLDFNNEEIKDIIISLELQGLDLKRNHAKRNKLIDKKINI